MDRNAIKEIWKKHKGRAYAFPIGVLARNVETDSGHRFVSDEKLEELESKLDNDSALDDNTVTFNISAARENIHSGESQSTIFGKIARWLNDLKTAAFCYATESLMVTEPGTLLDGRVGKTINDKFGGLRFYEDASGGKYVVGADSVPKKLGSTPQGEWTVVAEEWFGDNSGIPGNFTANGGYVIESNNWRYVLAKDYDAKPVRGDYAQLTADDFTVEVTSFRYAIDNMGHAGDVFNLAGPSVHAYSPETGILTIKCEAYFSRGSAGGESVSLKVKTRVCA